MEFEKLHTVTEYWDGPRRGIADLDGRPHYFEAIFDYEADGYSDRFWVQPIDDITFRLALEDWAIWLRWRRSYGEGLAGPHAHPALERDHSRSEELRELLEERLKIDAATAIEARAEFRGPLAAGAVSGVEVKWTRVEAA